MGITAAQRLSILDSIQKLAYSTSAEQDDELYDQFKESAPVTVLTYVDSNWHEIRDEWVPGLK
jgi:hypothetical protein